MKVLVTGATGVLGRSVVARLVAAGHSVRGLSRSTDNAALLRRLGVEPVGADLFDVDSLREALLDCDAVLHLATKIPPTSRAGRVSAWAENDRIRREGARALVTASLASETVRTFIYSSFALIYRIRPRLCRPRSMPRLRLRDSRRRRGAEASRCAWARSIARLVTPRRISFASRVWESHQSPVVQGVICR